MWCNIFIPFRQQDEAASAINAVEEHADRAVELEAVVEALTTELHAARDENFAAQDARVTALEGLLTEEQARVRTACGERDALELQLAARSGVVDDDANVVAAPSPAITALAAAHAKARECEEKISELTQATAEDDGVITELRALVVEEQEQAERAEDEFEKERTHLEDENQLLVDEMEQLQEHNDALEDALDDARAQIEALHLDGSPKAAHASFGRTAALVTPGGVADGAGEDESPVRCVRMCA